MYMQLMLAEQNNGNLFQTKKTHPRAKFTKEEDEILKDLVKNFGENNWQAISSNMPGRNSRQCRERWQNYLSPDVVNGPWTHEEDELLVAKYNELGPSWKQISAFFPTRTDINIKSRWNLRERHLRKEDLKIKKALLKNTKGSKCSSTFETNFINNQSINNYQYMQAFQQFPQKMIIDHKKEEIKLPIKKKTPTIPDQPMISSEPLPFFTQEVQINDGNEQELNLAFDDCYDMASNDCMNFLMLNEENSFDQWF